MMNSHGVRHRTPLSHEGGVAGLAPDEVPAILRRGEAVLTPGQMRALGAGHGLAERTAAACR